MWPALSIWKCILIITSFCRITLAYTYPMIFDFNLYSSMLLIFFVHGLVYTIILLVKGSRFGAASDFWLAIFLGLCVLYILPWMTGFAGWYNKQPYRDFLFYTPFQHLFFIGPVVYFYTQSLLNPGFYFSKKAYWHFLPGVLYLVFCVVMVVTDKLILKEYFFLASKQDPDLDTWYQVTGFASMFGYAVLSLRFYKVFRRVIVQLASYADSLQFNFVQHFLVAFMGMLSLRLAFFVIDAVWPLNYIGNWWYFLGFALLFYYIAIFGFSARTSPIMPYYKLNYDHQPEIYLPISTKNTTLHTEVLLLEAPHEQNTKVQLSDSFMEWKPKVEEAMQKDKLYENPQLTLTSLSKHLQTNPSHISKVVNTCFGKNFNDFVNSYRIEAVKTAIEKGEYKHSSLEGIGYEHGFNSKATFFRTFKKHAGCTPAKYIARLNKQIS